MSDTEEVLRVVRRLGQAQPFNEIIGRRTDDYWRAGSSLLGNGYDRWGVDVRGDRGRRGTTTVWVIDPTIGRADIPVLCDRVADVLRSYGCPGVVVVCEVGGIAEPSAVTVEVLARLRLTARRFGADFRVRGAHVRLRQLVVFTGLGEIIPLDGGSALEPHWQAEQREKPLDVEEIGDPADPAG